MQVDLFEVLIWFRKFRYVFSADVEKMYRQIKVSQSDWDFQRILWFDSSKNITTYQLTTVTYGLACAPFLALRSFEQLVNDEGNKFPLAVPVLREGRYVDDIFGGGNSVSQAQEVAKQTMQLCMAGGFPLQKWVSNHPSILRSIPTDKQADSLTIKIEENTIIQTLGLSWRPSSDSFHFITEMSSITTITKRTVLSTIAKLFDPLGLISPVIIKAKILMQELWSIKLEWDDPLPTTTAIQWETFINQLQGTSLLTFPRWISSNSDQNLEIHGFCDASQQAICAAVYTRVTNNNGEMISTLVCAKTKVAPLKRLTIPRLELSGAVILTKLVTRVLAVLKLNNPAIYMWTDSAVTYAWINNHPSRWKDFVHNRVCFIQVTLPNAVWKFVPGTDNPADCATRGMTPDQLSNHSVWWTGPHWLQKDSSMWPQTPQSPSPRDNLEERPSQVTIVTRANSTQPWNLLYRYSNLTRLLRITVWCMRAVARFKRSSDFSTGPLTTVELETAKFFWIRIIQQVSFQHEFTILSKGQQLPRSNSLLRLTPFLDTAGLLRVGGRLHSANLPTDTKHPLILPRSSAFTSLVISDAHIRTVHGGTQVTLSVIRDEYWIIGGRAPVRSFILKCVKCARYRQRRAQQIMGQLPVERVTPSRPFLHSGIDYAGPFLLKTWKGKNARKYKAYIVLFVCHATSAVHLEIVTDYTTEAFVAAYKRFTARRGICATLRSDCGTNLKGADVELRNLFAASSKELGSMANILANDGTQWNFNPPSAPHFGGKWEAGVKSVKFHLKRVVGDTLLTYEEMTTLTTQIEAVFNSRPLHSLSDDPNDFSALTPGHFLIGSALVTVPEPSLKSVHKSHLSRWQLTRQMLESFWAHWSKECLQRYLAVYKWNRSNPPLQEGSLVLVVDERYPPSKWPLGRIIHTHPGKDGHTRVVTVRTQTSLLKRPIVKICPLPIDTHTA